MTEVSKGYREVEEFLNGWQEEIPAVKGCFARLVAGIRALEGVTCTFMARPGISYSLRPKHHRQQDRSFFMVIDIIDDDPEARWLSVCFYADLINDPDGRGEVIPGGLAGGDGYCFDLFAYDEELVDYLEKRYREAYGSVRVRAVG